MRTLVIIVKYYNKKYHTKKLIEHNMTLSISTQKPWQAGIKSWRTSIKEIPLAMWSQNFGIVCTWWCDYYVVSIYYISVDLRDCQIRTISSFANWSWTLRWTPSKRMSRMYCQRLYKFRSCKSFVVMLTMISFYKFWLVSFVMIAK